MYEYAVCRVLPALCEQVRGGNRLVAVKPFAFVLKTTVCSLMRVVYDVVYLSVIDCVNYFA